MDPLILLRIRADPASQVIATVAKRPRDDNRKIMCLAIPHKVISLKGTKAKVQCGTTTHSLDVRLLKNVKPGDYLLNENQFAVYKLSKKDAEKTLTLFNHAQA